LGQQAREPASKQARKHARMTRQQAKKKGATMSTIL
jgi:hypothetical protein